MEQHAQDHQIARAVDLIVQKIEKRGSGRKPRFSIKKYDFPLGPIG